MNAIFHVPDLDFHSHVERRREGLRYGTIVLWVAGMNRLLVRNVVNPDKTSLLSATHLYLPSYIVSDTFSDPRENPEPYLTPRSPSQDLTPRSPLGRGSDPAKPPGARGRGRPSRAGPSCGGGARLATRSCSTKRQRSRPPEGRADIRRTTARRRAFAGPSVALNDEPGRMMRRPADRARTAKTTAPSSAPKPNHFPIDRLQPSRTRKDSLAGQVPLELLSQVLGRLEPLRRRLFQALDANRLQVARELRRRAIGEQPAGIRRPGSTCRTGCPPGTAVGP